MTPKFSAYLDCVRFIAALIVFLGHASGKLWTAGFLWQLGAYGDSSVVVFFVLSGFVIAYVCDVKERTWETYASNRVARLLSVVIPALILTYFIDLAGTKFASDLYLNQPWYADDHQLLRYLASLLMLQEVWHVKLVPGINQPFWSLSYEAFYYLIFGLVLFLKTRVKWLFIILAMLAAGPLIIALFPIWALGYFAYHVSKRTSLNFGFSALLFFAGLGVLYFSPSIRGMLPFKGYILGEEIFGRYVDGIGFFANLLGAYGLSRSKIPFPSRLGKSITSVASTTFVLYLFHRPLIQFFSYVGPNDPGGWQRRLLVVGGTLFIVFLATPATETLRRIIRVTAFKIFSRRVVST